jgi:Tol biopolymer transport system component/regulation of enolase protein 1 (concanavalin A-like superfamily)
MNHVLFSTTVLSMFCSIIAYGQQPRGMFADHADVGTVTIAGNVVYSAADQSYLISGSGENIWFDNDAFHFAFNKVKGDFIVRARMNFIGVGDDAHRKIGWMIRNDLSAGSAHASAVLHGDGLAALQYRNETMDQTYEVKSSVSAPDVLQIERSGNEIIMSVAHFGEAFKPLKITHAGLNDELYVGLFVCAHNPKALEQAMFTNVRYVEPAGERFVRYKEYLGSNLEIMDIETGLRKILYSAPNSIQAPNWTVDGKYLIFNSDGLLYKYSIEHNTVSVIDTSPANSNNNDHVISFDGQQLAISNHDPDSDDQSIIYTLPITGGRPVKITEHGPSYLHGWSPDGDYLVFCGARNDQYDVYKIGIKDKKEIQLTDFKGLDDGPEYTPDGKFIYFNSNRTGTMQIWRMKPNGNDQEQITFDEHNDWFAHISPDGQQLVFLSFPPTVDSGAHPFYKRVMLRTMPITGGTPKVVAYLYGGQGTINVPSWSPDSKMIAFVSNSGHLNLEKK